MAVRVRRGRCRSGRLARYPPLARRLRSGLFFFSSRRRHTRSTRDWSSDVCSSDLDELAYTRSLLDKQPQMQHIKDRLTELLTIGSIGTPSVRGNYYFHTQRDGKQNQDRKSVV